MSGPSLDAHKDLETEFQSKLQLSQDAEQERPSLLPKQSSDSVLESVLVSPSKMEASDTTQATSNLVSARDFANTPKDASGTALECPVLPSVSSLSSPRMPGRIASSPAVPSSSAANPSKALGALRNRTAGQGTSARNVPIPPTLQARVAAGLANRNSPIPEPTPSTSKTPTNNAKTHLSSSDRIDASSFLGKTSQSSLQPARPPPPIPGGSSGVAARRRNIPGLSLTAINGGFDASPSGRVGANGPMPSGMTGRPMPVPMNSAAPGKRKPPGLSLAGMSKNASTPFSNFNKIVDPSGRLSFENKAVLHAKGVDFSNGASFNINMEDLTLQEELGHGNYGTVQKVCHKTTGVIMAMKEIRLELDESKLKAIITELDILHRATSPEIVEFYGAFFIESCVYYCMEYMDAGSLEQLAGYHVPEDVLARITHCMIRGLRFLKDELQTMHRDVKPTNVLMNKKGEVKLCDFGVSTQLEKSLAKTNIGCQSYMAPERIKGESQGNVSTYTVASDVWSVGLSIIEVACGHYPYPPETYSNVFAQLQAIVHGDPPGLPDGYSAQANDFVAFCLMKDPNRRPSYKRLMEHPFLVADSQRDVDMVGYVARALEARAQRQALASTPTSAGSSSDR